MADSRQLSPLNWDDLRLILAIARSGSLNAAATVLQVNVSTASRRLSQVECALGIVCFVRRPSGIITTPAGQRVVDHAEEIERQTIKLRREAASETELSSSSVTITAPDSLGASIIMPALEKHAGPDFPSIDLITDNRMLDLQKGEADLALRLRRPLNGGLKIRKLCDVSFGLFASQEYLERNGTPTTTHDLANHSVIALRTHYPNHATAVLWEQASESARVALRTDRTFDRLVAARQHLGITMLPRTLGLEWQLSPVLEEIKLPPLEAFLLAEPGSLRLPEVRLVAEKIASYAKRQAAKLAS